MKINLNGTTNWNTIRVPADDFYNDDIATGREFKNFCLKNDLNEDTTQFDITNLDLTKTDVKDYMLITFTYKEI